MRALILIFFILDLIALYDLVLKYIVNILYTQILR